MKNFLPKISQLRSVYLVAQYGSINGAAKAASIPQPTLSKSIKELEEQLGCQLLVRGSRGIVLTEAGKIFAEHASSIVRELERAVKESRLTEGIEDGKLSIGLSPITINSIFDSALESLLTKFPRCRISVEESPLELNVPRLRNGALDLAVGNVNSDVNLQDFEIEPLMSCPYAVVCAKGSEFEHASSVEELENAKWWITGEFKICQRTREDFKNLSIRQALHTRSHLVGLPMVLRYGFLALLSSVQIRCYREKITVLPIKDLNVRGQFGIIYSKNASLPVMARRCIDFLHEEADRYDWESF